MADKNTRDQEERALRADPRYTEIPQPCIHCKHLISVGSQFRSDGWTCSAFPEEILYDILTREHPHTEPRLSQVGTDVYDPKIYTEDGTGRQWHYTADGGWRYVDEAGPSQ